MCVCVCEREREKRERYIYIYIYIEREREREREDRERERERRERGGEREGSFEGYPSPARRAPAARSSRAWFTKISLKMCLLISFRKSTPPQNRQLIVYYQLSRYSVHTLVGQLTV